ncbi:cytochrome P450 [Multifurca ochricompacta]|uniref:Cytochrome P450 n=1 Tax=Multifurca ochricompacta TaxID=376703 RepID=A0AAD4LWG3_9AGAM|nr:cytochrome P450 [Multifurca ochricompacta]
MSFIFLSSSQLCFTCALALCFFLRPLFTLILSRFRSPLRLLPSPPSPSFLIGNLAQIADQENNDIFRSWTDQYGHTLVYRGFINGHRLLTTDPLALAYILGHAYDFPKPNFITEALAEMGAGHNGLLTVQGDIHRRQRRIMNQAFTSSHIKSIIPIFRGKAERLRDIFIRLADTQLPATTHFHHASPPLGTSAVPHSQLGPPHLPSTARQRTPSPSTSDPSVVTSPVVDVLTWLARATLDAIGEAGFGYSFHSLPPPGTDPRTTSESGNELARAFATIFTTAHEFRVATVLSIWFPFVRRFRSSSHLMQEAQATMHRIGTQLISERKMARIQDEPKPDAPVSRDILSVLVRANTASSPSQALTHSEMLSQISTFLAAGHETTASALAWTLYALARAPAAQTRLRAALRTCAEGDLHAALELPLLEHTVREALRLHAPVGSTMRVYTGAASECFVPLQYPVRVRVSTWRSLSRWLPYRARSPAGEEGENDQWRLQSGIHLRRGDMINIPIQTVNCAPDLWGPDARLFRPERWTALPPAVRAIPGLYAHTLTFLNGNGGGAAGNRACIGYRFALAEIKVFLACLLRDIEFSIDDDVVIEKRVNIVTRPFVASAPEMGNQMPLRVRRVPPDENAGVVSAGTEGIQTTQY